MNDQDEILRLRKRLEREKNARLEAEQLLEQKSLSLYESNQNLAALTQDLEAQVKQRTAELTQALQKAEAGVLARQHFLALMSHEIRTPLHGMLGLIDLLVLSPLNTEQASQTEIIRSSGRSLLRLLNDILELSRIDSGAFDIELEPLEINDVISGVVQLYKPLAREKNLHLTWESKSDLAPRLLGDESRIRQVLSNLLSNAVKFTLQGKVHIVSKAVRDENHRWAILIIVKDTGIGIDAEKIPTLFNEFTQANFSIHKQFGGTGLGLAISRKLIESMGGELTARSQAGEGSEFKINVTLACAPNTSNDSSSAQTTSNAVPTPRNREGLRVLVVDDNLVNRTLMASFLKRFGIDASLACDGQESIQTIQNKGPYDLVFMDLVMPYMDGLDTTRHIRELPIQQPYVCGLSANAFKADKEKCMAAGMNMFLEKPLSFEKFCEFMRNLP
ncbi:ATP-binding protein [Limnobacter parvus]|uniref:histidine kinase n=1 Tax=Limnobacter parvus TaxID=2939690 RepID=A0ABT1XGX5_9BURK|nr:ATP-binding protein [Limnobacter parvus]MCR2746527.1 ATP-binding protein [Limnobacter parvus]